MITIILVDEDEVYCEKLSSYILKKREPIELVTITKKEYLPLIFNTKAEVLVITPQNGTLFLGNATKGSIYHCTCCILMTLMQTAILMM